MSCCRDAFANKPWSHTHASDIWSFFLNCLGDDSYGATFVIKHWFDLVSYYIWFKYITFVFYDKFIYQLQFSNWVKVLSNGFMLICTCANVMVSVIIPPAQRSCWGVYWFHSVQPSVHPPIRPFVAWEWWEFQWSNKWNWYSSGLNTSILVWHTCAIALLGWVLYRQLELTKLTLPDLHHVVGLFILRDVRPSVPHPVSAL